MTTATSIGTLIALLFGLAALATAVSALTIVSPAPGQYGSPVAVNIRANQTQDAISYTLTPGNASETCTNCTALSGSEALDAGNYTLAATATLGNATEQANVSFEVLPPVPPTSTFSVTILDPTDETYGTSAVPITLATNATVDTLGYQLDNGTVQQACVNCSSFQTTLNVSDGNHTLAAEGTLGNETETASVSFTVQQPVQQPDELTLTVASPLAQDYTSPVQLSFQTSLPSTINYSIDNQTVQACVNCTDYEASQVLDEGSHTLTVLAAAQNRSANATVVFSVVNATTNETENETNGTGNDGNESGAPRFSLGFEQLPQMVASGNITDDELAAIIRANRLNPGILNRLIKTGKLGNESITAIIETQSAPPGIFQRILGFFGFHVATPKDELAAQYNLTDNQEAMLLTQNDVSPQVSAKLKKDLQTRAGQHGPSTPPGQAKRENDEGNTNLPAQDQPRNPGDTPFPRNGRAAAPGQTRQPGPENTASGGTTSRSRQEGGSLPAAPTPSNKGAGSGQGTGGEDHANPGNSGTPPGQAKHYDAGGQQSDGQGNGRGNGHGQG